VFCTKEKRWLVVFCKGKNNAEKPNNPKERPDAPTAVNVKSFFLENA
jgi:hypothetical protein